MVITHKKQLIHWQSAQVSVKAAIEKASELGVHIAVAVVDSSGQLVAFLRSENAPYMSINIAIDKAYTSASFSIPTSQWREVLPQGSLLREGIVQRDRFVAFGGGVPIRLGDDCVGAIGVSGASEEQDELCAQAGLDAIT